MSLIVKVTLSYGDLTVLEGTGYPAWKVKMNKSLLSTPKDLNVFNRYFLDTFFVIDQINVLLCVKLMNAKLKYPI